MIGGRNDGFDQRQADGEPVAGARAHVQLADRGRSPQLLRQDRVQEPLGDLDQSLAVRSGEIGEAVAFLVCEEGKKVHGSQ